MNALNTALTALNQLHANAGNIPPHEYRDILAMLHSIRFITEKLIKLFGGADHA